MPSRFDQVILVGLAAGALQFAGCDVSCGNCKSKVEYSTVFPRFTGAHAIDGDHLSLFFAGPVKVAPDDRATVAANFALRGVTKTYDTSDTFGRQNLCVGTSGGTTCSQYSSLLVDPGSHQPQYGVGDLIANGADISPSSSDSSRLILTLDGTISLAADDADTGVLVLTQIDGFLINIGYSSSSEISGLPHGSDPIYGLNGFGNVGADPERGPIVVRLISISNNEIRLTLTEPVSALGGDAVGALGGFTLSHWAVNGDPVQVYEVPGFTPHTTIVANSESPFHSGEPITLSSLRFGGATPTTYTDTFPTNQMLLRAPLSASSSINDWLRVQYSPLGTEIQNRDGQPLEITIPGNLKGNIQIF